MKHLIKILAASVLLVSCNSKHQSNTTLLPAIQAMPVSNSFNLSEIPNPSGQWVFVTSDMTNGSQIFVGVDTVQRQGNFVRFWQKRILLSPNQFGSSIYLNYQSIDCRAGVFRFHKDIYLDAGGNIINQGVGDSPLQNIIPGSVGAEVFTRVCVLPINNSYRQTNAEMINEAMKAGLNAR